MLCSPRLCCNSAQLHNAFMDQKNLQLVASDLRRSFRIGSRRIDVLRGISLDVAYGEAVFLCGPSAPQTTPFIRWRIGAAGIGARRIEDAVSTREMKRRRRNFETRKWDSCFRDISCFRNKLPGLSCCQNDWAAHRTRNSREEPRCRWSRRARASAPNSPVASNSGWRLRALTNDPTLFLRTSRRATSIQNGRRDRRSAANSRATKTKRCSYHTR